MKKILFVFATLLICAGCNKEKDQGIVEQGTLKIQVSPFSLEQEDMNGAKNAASASEAVTRISYALFDANNSVVWSSNQNSTADAATFGQMSCTVAAGTYTLVVVGHRCTGNATITSPILVSFPQGELTDCFSATQSVTVTGSASQNVGMTLDRVVSLFRLVATDVIPSNVYSMTISFTSGGETLNPTTGLAMGSAGRTCTMNISSAQGTSNNQFGAFILLNSDPQTMNVTATAKGINGEVIQSHQFSNVEFNRNRRTIATGVFFAGTSQGTFTFNTDWLDANNIPY